MAGAPESRWTERWGELAVLAGGWTLACVVVWGTSRLPDVRRAWGVRHAAGVPIADALKRPPGSVVRVRGLPEHRPGVTTLRDQSGALELPGTFVGLEGDPRV